MTTLTRKKNKLTWHDVLRSVQMLSPQDQRRLRDELAKSAGVYLVVMLPRSGEAVVWPKRSRLNWLPRQWTRSTKQ